ncbi:MAG: MoaD/ThiS family protein [Proteobacteria bacterium]|nr:MoaD/ThiS family protein [Pseudomonadota bacterium]
MNIEVRTFINFKSYMPPDAKDGKAVLSIKDGATFSDLLNELGIPLEEPRIVVLNGVSQGTAPEVNTRVLNDGDIVAIFPPIGGG